MIENIIEIMGNITNGVSAIVGVIVGFSLNLIMKFLTNRKETKLIITVINDEILNNYFVIFKPEKTYYDGLRTDTFEFIKLNASSLSINKNQLLLLFKIYRLFERIKNRKLDLEEGKKDSKGFPKTNGLNELSSRCCKLIEEYQNKYDKKNRIFK